MYVLFKIAAKNIIISQRNNLKKKNKCIISAICHVLCKSHHRRTFTNNYNDLKAILPITLSETMSLAFVRRAARFCLRFMSGYRAGLSGPLLDFTMKKFKSHRTIPLGIVDTVTQQFNEHLKAKALKAKK